MHRSHSKCWAKMPVVLDLGVLEMRVNPWEKRHKPRMNLCCAEAIASAQNHIWVSLWEFLLDFFLGAWEWEEGRGRDTLVDKPEQSLCSLFQFICSWNGLSQQHHGSYLGGSSHPQHPVQPQKPCTAASVFWSTGNSLSFDLLGEEEETNTGKAARFQLR